MKYAVLAMVVVYVIALNISPKEEGDVAASHAQGQHKVSDVGELKQSGAHAKENVSTSDMSGEKHEAAAAEEAVEVKAPANKWEALSQSATKNVLALMNGDATLPQTKKEVEPAQQKAAAPRPCGLLAAQAHHDQVADTKPCPVVCPGMKVQEGEAEVPALDAAMQNLVKATNDMVAVTRQLVGATEEMLYASKKVAVEVIDSGKGLLENKEAHAAAEAKLTQAVQDVVDATREAYEATSEAISGAVEAQKQ